MRVALYKIKPFFAICVYFLLQWLDVTQIMTGAAEVQNVGVPGKTCRLKPDDGPCRGNIPMYYYDPKAADCKKFAWGGCQGNGNRFNTRKECYRKCFKNDTSIKTRPSWCSLSFDYGYCFGAVPRFYYDPLWKVCKERIYSGCGGNQNNFYSFERCQSICIFNHNVKDLLERKNRKGHKAIIINPAGATQKRGLYQSITTRSDAT